MNVITLPVPVSQEPREHTTTEQPTIVSRTGTRHIVGIPSGEPSIRAHIFRVTTYCGFGVRPEEALTEAIRDCEFCQAELEKELRRKAGEAEERSKACTAPPPRD